MNWEHAHADLATLFDGQYRHLNIPYTGEHFDTAWHYAGYRPTVAEAPNGDAMVDAGRAGKRYLHVATKYDPPDWALAYLARAHWEACRVAERIGVPAAYYPRAENGALRVLEYPSAAHVWIGSETFASNCVCRVCGVKRDTWIRPHLCPALAAGAGTAEHRDAGMFTLNLWRSTPEDHEVWDEGEPRHIPPSWQTGADEYHIGEIGELVGLGPAVMHRVPARPYTQRALVYFAIPDHAARLPVLASILYGVDRSGVGPTVGEWLAERMARSRVEVKP